MWIWFLKLGEEDIDNVLIEPSCNPQIC